MTVLDSRKCLNRILNPAKRPDGDRLRGSDIPDVLHLSGGSKSRMKVGGLEGPS